MFKLENAVTILLLSTLLVAGMLGLRHGLYLEGKERTCKDACFPIVHRVIGGKCYCADGENWKRHKPEPGESNAEEQK